MSATAAHAAPSSAAAAERGRASAIYQGIVQHRRLDRIGHRFAHRLFQVYLDLDELPELTAAGGPLATRWWRPLRYRRRDYLAPADRPLADVARDAVAEAIGTRPEGPVRMLTNLCTFGFAFNPVTFYYCFCADGRLAAVLAEITNTPWGERHRYCVAAGADGARGTFVKAFHVSPFQPMAQTYEWRFSVPGELLQVLMQNRVGGDVVFAAGLSMQRGPLTTASLRQAWRRHPWTTAKVILAIHWHALRLWWKGATFHPHPRKHGARR